MQHHPQSIVTPPVLDGRVFARQQLFMTLPQNLQEDTKQFRAYIEQDKSRLFQNHHHALVKSVYSVRGKDLIDTIIRWLEQRHASAQNALARNNQAQNAHVQKSSAKKAATLAFAATNAGQTWEAPNSVDPTETSTSTKSLQVAKERLECARQIAEALVLLGFLTSYKDGRTPLSFIAPEHHAHDRTLLIPVAPSVTDLKTTSVWSVADGAMYARALKRKIRVFGQFTTTGRSIYVVVNAKTKKLYVFESDLARDLILELSGPTLSVQLDNQQFDFDVRVSSTSSGLGTEESELFHAETKSLQDEFVNACIDIGAKYEGADAQVNGLVGHDAVPGYQTKHVETVKGPHENAVTESASTSRFRPVLTSDSKLPHAGTLANEPAVGKDQNRSVGTQPTSVEHQKQHGGSYSTSAVQHRDHIDVYAGTSAADAPVSAQHQNQRALSTLATDAPILTKHHVENGVDMYAAPHIAP